MSAPRPTVPSALAIGMLLTIAGFAAWVLHALQSGREQHSYAPGRPPPQYVQVEATHTYTISIPGGVRTERQQGLDPSKLACTGAAAGQGPEALQITVENGDSKAVNQIGSFPAVLTEMIHVDCSGIGAVYIDDAADAGTDWALVWLVIAAAGLVVGLPLTLSGLRQLSVRPREDHQVQ